jgi:hypothetical protein
MLTGELPPLTSDADHADRLLVSKNHKELNNFHDSIFRKGLNQAFGERFKNPKELLLALNNKNYLYNNTKHNYDTQDLIKTVIQETQDINPISSIKTNIINEKIFPIQTIDMQLISWVSSIEILLDLGNYSKAEKELSLAKRKYGSKNNDLLYLENRLLREKKKSFFSPIIMLISALFIIVSFIFYSNEIKKSSSIAPAPVIQKTKDSIPIKDFLERHIDTDILAHYNNKLNEFEEGRDKVENISYRHNSQFDYTNYYGLSTNSIPNGLGKATNRGINPKNNVPYNSVIQGEFVNGLLNGYGKLEQFDGSEYTGFFKDGLPHGEGTYYENKNSTPITVTCENGKCTPK